MNKEIMLKALMETAKAYLKRGAWLQYDQLSMDRVAGISMRKLIKNPPEAATPEHYHYLDCSSFCWSCYYQTFGYMMESFLSWHMIDIVKPRVFYHEFTHEETPQQLAALKAQLLGTFQPGDIIVYELMNGNGHVMMYVNSRCYINCTQKGVFNGFSYTDNKNVYSSYGGICLEEMSSLLGEGLDEASNRNNLLSENKKRIAVLRPLENCAELTPSAAARIGEAAGLIVSVTTGYPEGRTRTSSESITYTVKIKNGGTEDKKAALSFAAPSESALLDCGCFEDAIASGAEAVYEIRVKPLKKSGLLGAPKVNVNGLDVWAPEVYIGRTLDEKELSELNAAADDTFLDGTPSENVWECYARLMDKKLPRLDSMMYRLFLLHDSKSGDVLRRWVQEPETDMAAPLLFGGRGVVSPDNCCGSGERATALTRDSLIAGDILLISDDACCTKQYSCYYDGSSLKGSFSFGEAARTIEGEEMEKFIDSLFGRFAFCVLRPSLSMK